MIVVRFIMSTLFAILVIGTLLWIPYMLVKAALFSLIGRPFGFGWKAVRAEIRPYAPTPDPRIRIPVESDAPLMYAEYTYGGNDYKVPVLWNKPDENGVLYINKKQPHVVWHPAYENRATALVAVLLIAGLWFGLVLGGILIYREAVS